MTAGEGSSNGPYSPVMQSNAVVRWWHEHPVARQLVSIAAGAACFVLLWLAGAGTIALAAGVLFVIAETLSVGARLLRAKQLF